MATTNEYQLTDSPTEGISSVAFSPTTSQFLLASSWDCSVRLYDISSDKTRFRYDHNSPVLDACFTDSVVTFSGDMKGNVLTYNINAGAQTFVGCHNEAVRCVEFCPEVNALVTGSWDKSIRLWDPRGRNVVGSYNQPDKVYTMSICGHRVIVGTAGKHVIIYDLRNMSVGEEQRRESSLKYQTRCIRAFPNQQGYVLSSIEGRVAVEYLDPSPKMQKRKYAFKSHRIKENGRDFIYPVHAIAFHNQYNTFATGGADCFVNMWDGMNKKRLCQFHRFPAAVSSLAFSGDGTTLAIACSSLYSCEPNLKDKNINQIFIRKVTDTETKPSRMPSNMPPTPLPPNAGGAQPARIPDYSAEATTTPSGGR